MKTEITTLKELFKELQVVEFVELGRTYVLLPDFFKIPGSVKKIDLLFCCDTCPRGYPTMLYFQEKFSFKHGDRWQAPVVVNGRAWHWFSFRVEGANLKEKILTFFNEVQGE